MKRLIIGLMLVGLIVAAVACAASQKESSAPAPMPAPAPRPASAPPPIISIPAPASAPMPAKDGGTTSEGSLVTYGAADESWATERMIVRTANMWLVVNDVPDALEQIAAFAGDFDGYVVSSKRWQEGERLAGSIAIRVPAEHFDNVMGALRGMAVDITSEDTSSRDVTEEYVDLSAKLKNLEATEEQLLRLMEKAEKVEDILNVQRELSNTRGEIEQTKGRMQYLERTSATSLIEVSLEQAQLGVKFTADKASVKAGERIQFFSEVAGGFAPYSYEWDFGDGDTSTIGVPSHAYKATGKYTVSLKVTDDRGNTDTETRSDYVTVIPGWSAGNIASSVWNGLSVFGRALADIFIWLGIFSPVWIVIGGGLYWWLRRRKRA